MTAKPEYADAQIDALIKRLGSQSYPIMVECREVLQSLLTERIELAWSADDDNSGELARNRASEWINDQDHPGSWRLVPVYLKPNAIAQTVSVPSSETMMLNDRAYEIPVDGIQARYRLPGGEWSTWAHVICGVKTHEMQLRAVGFYPDRHACLHPSWENAGNGKWRCACCNVIGDEKRYLQPDGELDRVYDRAERQALLSATHQGESV